MKETYLTNLGQVKRSEILLSGANHKARNRLWLYRKKLRYSQKIIAHLLGHQSAARVSNYERGNRTPSLETALKLSVILQTSIPLLYPGLYAQLKHGIKKRERRLKGSPR